MSGSCLESALKKQPKAKPKLIAGEKCRAIEEEVRSLAERIDHFKSRIPRVNNTVELSDYFEGKAGKPGDAEAEPCYCLDSALNLSDAELSA